PLAPGRSASDQHTRGRHDRQYWSALTTSAPARVDSDWYTPDGGLAVNRPVAGSYATFVGAPFTGLYGHVLTESFTKRTDPSRNAKLQPPGWKLDAAIEKLSSWASKL